MAANKKFTPRASSNLIEEEVTTDKETTAEETAVTVDCLMNIAYSAFFVFRRDYSLPSQQ